MISFKSFIDSSSSFSSYLDGEMVAWEVRIQKRDDVSQLIEDFF